MVHGRSARWVALLALLLLAGTPRSALGFAPPTRVSVLTMGPGDHPFTRFGHNALLLQWDGTSPPRDQVYNFGTFAFDGLQGVRDFMAGHFRYWLSVTSLGSTLRSYAAAGRSLSAQELELTTRERAKLYELLEDNARPEHRYYDYDYYRDNCSTRVRDSIDRLLGGELQRQLEGPGRLTFRQHTLRLLDDAPWLYWGLDLALGAPTDGPTTRWQELFLPDQLHDALAHATRTLHGQRVPLIRAETRLLRAERQGAPTALPEHLMSFAAFGGLAGLVLSGLGYAGSRSRPARQLFRAVTVFLGTFFGLLGIALLVFSISKHEAAHDNVALLACPPWTLALAVFGARRAPSPNSFRRPLVWVSGASALASLTLLLLSLTHWPRSHQQGLREGVLFTLIWLGWLGGTWLQDRGTRGALVTP